MSLEEKNASKIQQILDTVQALALSNEKIQKDVEVIKSSQSLHLEKFSHMEKKVERINEKLSHKEKVERASNLLIFGVPENLNPKQTLTMDVIQLFEKVGAYVPEMCIITTYRVGKYSESNYRPILVKFIAPRWKKPLFEKIDEFRKLNLGISNDLSPEERASRKSLASVKRALIERGHVVSFRGSTILKDKVPISDAELHDILEEIQVMTSNINARENYIQPTVSETTEKTKALRKSRLNQDDILENFINAPNTIKKKIAKPGNESKKTSNSSVGQMEGIFLNTRNKAVEKI